MESAALTSSDTPPSGMVVWMTGRPASGKSTLADMVRRELVRRGYACVIVDGDEVRRAVVPPHDYSSQGRDDFYATLTNLAAMLARQGVVVLVAATSHRAAHRARAREVAGSFCEVYVDTPAWECERRDPKALYAEARAGLADVPGASFEFEAPVSPEVVARGGKDCAALAAIVDRVSRSVG